ncbi:GFA family protein [Alginatibacterium sediminis]|uniref:GFA family protein n=1 Tax=Alginatibacterium sediminis TaxID=2164068 RepID=A0A420EHZ8_9ALTE|nr:GFA family protein [Alginatibacterium sediminis]RKF20284.1 GFA family protein [Alginatibacterium sediminis]
MYYGKCLCGDVTIEVSGEITEIIHCHCSLCRKNSGTAFATNGFINTSDLKITSGKSKLGVFSFKAGRYRHFCRKCACPVYSSNDNDPKRLRLRLGILDSQITERPSAHIFVASKANWELPTADLPSYSEFEPNRK